MENHRILKVLLFSLIMGLLFSPQLMAQQTSDSKNKVENTKHKSNKEKHKTKKEHITHQKQKDWNVFLTTYYTSRKIKGNVTRKNSLTGGSSSDLYATGKTLDLDRSSGLMYGLGAQYKHWFLGLTYMPSRFEDQGNGYSYFDLTGPNGTGVLTEVNTNTDVDIDMYLANIMYEAARTPHTSFKVGLGLGASDVKFHITPHDTIIKEIKYNNSQPFGYVTINMSTNWKRFLFAANANGVQMTLDGININYLDFTTQVGYRAYQDYFNIDIIAGFRMVNFALSGSMDDDGPPPVTHDYGVDLTLEGAFIGITLSY